MQTIATAAGPRQCVSMVRWLVQALAIVAGMVFMSPIAKAAGNACIGRAAEIVGKAYPAASRAADGSFDLDGWSITAPADDRMDYETNSMVCRQWPARPDLFLVAVPLMKKSVTQGLEEGDLDILVMDNDTLAVGQRLRLENAMLADGVRIRDIVFDTALYQLSPQNLAFGIRVTKTNGSRIAPFDGTTLRLFSIDNGQMRLILDKLIVEEHGGDWDGNCDGEFTEMRRTLSMAKPEKGGVADIIVTEQAATTVNSTIATECESSDTTTRVRYRLRHTDGSYLLPKVLRAQ